MDLFLKFSLRFIFVLLFFTIISGCTVDKKSEEKTSLFPAKVTILGNQFIDDQGREVILNGINVVSKSKEEHYLFKGGPEYYADLKKWGFNSIRFIIIWDGLEPEPGVYNDDYLQEIDKRIAWAGENGLFVVLDMHQDLFSVKYADGAPEWATLDEGKTHLTGDVWSDAYMMSPAVQTAFDNFWNNEPAPDGVGLQDRYALLWQHIATRYADNPTVIGYDLMNEPFPGSPGAQAMPALLNAYGHLEYSLSGKRLSEEELSAIWTDVDRRTQALKLLSSEENFAQVIDAMQPLAHEFETNLLQPFYQKVANAIRAVDSTSVLFLEHSYFGNMGIRSSIERTHLSNGNADSLVAYAPHGYDLVVDTKNAAEASSERVRFIFKRIKEKGDALGMPIWLGEWGAFYQHDEAIVPVAQHAIQQIETHLFGNAYWSYQPQLENQRYFQEAIIRPYPAYTNGRLLSYSYDFVNKVLKVQWREEPGNNAPSLVYLPRLSEFDLSKMDQTLSFRVEEITDSDAGWLVIPPLGKQVDRNLAIPFH